MSLTQKLQCVEEETNAFKEKIKKTVHTKDEYTIFDINEEVDDILNKKCNIHKGTFYDKQFNIFHSEMIIFQDSFNDYRKEYLTCVENKRQDEYKRLERKCTKYGKSEYQCFTKFQKQIYSTSEKIHHDCSMRLIKKDKNLLFYDYQDFLDKYDKAKLQKNEKICSIMAMQKYFFDRGDNGYNFAEINRLCYNDTNQGWAAVYKWKKQLKEKPFLDSFENLFNTEADLIKNWGQNHDYGPMREQHYLKSHEEKVNKLLSDMKLNLDYKNRKLQTRDDKCQLI